MSKTLVLSVDKSSAMEGCQRFFTEPKLGNLKDPVKIQAKIQDHFDKMAEEAATNSLFAIPSVVSVCVVTHPDPDEEGMKVSMDQVSKVGQVEKFENEFEPLGTFLKGLTDVTRIIGPHPTTHTRMVQNTFIRGGIAVPACFGTSVIRVNVFELLCNRTEGEYPGCLPPLGITPVSPIEDTLKVANLLGLI